MPRYYPLNAYYPLIEMLVSCFNAILFALLTWFCFQDYRKRRTLWGGRLFILTVASLAVLFLAHFGNEIVTDLLKRRSVLFDVLEIAAKYLIPSMAFHVFYRNGRDNLTRHGMWRAAVALVYLMSGILGGAAINAAAIGYGGGWPGWDVADVFFKITMISGATGCCLVLWFTRRSNSGSLNRNQRLWLAFVCGTWILVFLFGSAVSRELGNILEKIVPLCFIFVLTYYVERFAFLDVLIKKGAFIFAALALLTLYFVVLPPLLVRLHFVTWIGTIVWALTAWPIVLLAPWGHRKLSAWLDRLWLGRRYSPAEATRHFLSGLQGIIGEGELAREAESHLRAIFRSEAQVRLSTCGQPIQELREHLMVAPILLKGATVGEMRVSSREKNIRFLSEDMVLLASLAEGFAFLLENLRLRERRLEQEKREQELLLRANRSELKALRAQINPHFLFNALNTIAGLIPRHPDRAEQTIEELAEVFRYTLRRSEREWVRLGEELEVVRSYLHIEQTRFGQGMQFRIEAGPDLEDLRVPAMVIQTLVENAVKHGITSVADSGLVEVQVKAADGRLQIEVRDNGPGFAASRTPASQSDQGAFGLRNVEERLKLYFGTAACLHIGRDDACGITQVRIDMPLTAQMAGVVDS